MSFQLHPWSVRVAEGESVHWAVEKAMDEVVSIAVWRAVRVNVDGVVWGAAHWAVHLASSNRPLHSNLHRFIGELHQFRGGVT